MALALVLHVSGLGLDTPGFVNIPASSQTYLQRGIKIIIIIIAVVVIDIITIILLSVWVTLRLHFKLKGYVSRQHLWTLRLGNSFTKTLPLKVFTQRNFVADFIFKNENRFLSQPLGDLGVTYALHL